MKLNIALIACVGFTSTLTAMPIVTAQSGVRAARIAMGIMVENVTSWEGYTYPVFTPSHETSSTTERDLPINVVEASLNDGTTEEAKVIFSQKQIDDMLSI